jgi:hypothetical protein
LIELKIMELKGNLKSNTMDRTSNSLWFLLERFMSPGVALINKNYAGYLHGSFAFFRLKIG